MKQIDYATAQSLADEIIDEYGGDVVYESVDGSCVYVHNGAPSCIVGHVLSRAEVDMSVFENSEANTNGIDALWRSGVVDLTGSALIFLSELQSYQDHGYTWGTAFEWAVDAVDIQFSA